MTAKQEQAKLFLTEYVALARKHGLTFDSCGCCSSMRIAAFGNDRMFCAISDSEEDYFYAECGAEEKDATDLLGNRIIIN